MRLFFLLATGLCYCLSAISQGIRFEKNASWSDVLSKAKDSGKLIFVDVYTDWCGPCREMNKDVFTLKSIGEKFNNKFVNYQLNAEKGEGPSLKSRYHVISYPTYLFVNGDGVLIYKAGGSMPPGQLSAVADQALKEAAGTLTIAEMDSLYPFRRKDKIFMYEYVRMRTRLRLENTVFLDEYFDLLNKKEQEKTENLQLVVDNGSFLNRSLQIGPAFEALLRNKGKFSLLKTGIYNHDIAAITQVAVDRTLAEAIKKKDLALLGKVLRLKDDRELFDNPDVIKLRYFWGVADYGEYIKQALAYAGNRLMTLTDDCLDSLDKEEYSKIIPEIDSSLIRDTAMTTREKDDVRHSYERTQTIQVTNMLFDISRNILRKSDDRDTLKLCLKFMMRCIHLAEKDTGYFRNVYPFYLDTYACYLYELNEKDEAVAREQQAVDLMSMWAKNKVPVEYTDQLQQMRKNESIKFYE